MIESDYVSSHIHLWIDYIFGYKQQGKEAEKALNVFPAITYENKANLNERDPKSDNKDDPSKEEMTLSLISRAYNYGQTPF